MARTTVDDCLRQCPNHFELAYRAARRARDIMNRGDPRVPVHGDKSIVISLREIADPNALADQVQPEHPAEQIPEAAAAYFGEIPPSPDEPDPTDPMGERERARFAVPGPDSEPFSPSSDSRDWSGSPDSPDLSDSSDSSDEFGPAHPDGGTG